MVEAQAGIDGEAGADVKGLINRPGHVEYSFVPIFADEADEVAVGHVAAVVQPVAPHADVLVERDSPRYRGF